MHFKVKKEGERKEDPKILLLNFDLGNLSIYDPLENNTECLIWTLEKKHFRKITEHILNITFEEINKNIEYIPVLSSLNYKIKNKIINHLYKGTFFANKPIFLRNDISHCIYFIKDGKIDVKLNDKVLYTLKEGDYFGELSVMLKCNRIYDFIPQTKCVLFSVPVSFLYDLCGENYPLEICLTIIKSAFINVENFNKFMHQNIHHIVNKNL